MKKTFRFRNLIPALIQLGSAVAAAHLEFMENIRYSAGDIEPKINRADAENEGIHND